MNLYNKPYPPSVMLAADWEPNKVEFPVIVQPKLNGIRAVLSPDGKIYKRSCIEIPLFANQFGAYGMWLDGEIYLDGWKLNKIAGLCNRKDANEDTMLLNFYAFDIVGYGTQVERLELLATINNNANVFSTHTLLCYSSRETTDLYKNLPDTAEGIIYRNPAAPYVHGRTNYLLKRKKLQTGDYKCTSVYPGVGKFDGTLGAFGCVTAEGVEFKVSAAELTDIERNEMWQNPPLGKLLSIRYPELSTYNIPQQAQFECVREGGI